MIKFIEEGHVYENIDPEKSIKWKGVTSTIDAFKEKFDKDAVAERSSKNKRSKWYGLSPDEIKAIWDKENKRAVDLGNWYHNQRERDVIELASLGKNGKELTIYPPIIKDGVKYAPDQKLIEGVYPELLVYSEQLGTVRYMWSSRSSLDCR